MSMSIENRKGRKEHVKYVKRIVEEKAMNKAYKRCPYCGSELVKRTGRFGDFLGCSRFPKCKYTNNDIHC